MARNYSGAAKELEEALQRNPGCKAIRRKLIVCFNEIGEIRRAFRCFLSLIKEDADFVIHTDPVDDDCPCHELVFDAESGLQNNQESLDYVLRLGMLWLYCDVRESVRYFKQAQNMAPDDGDIKAALALLKSKKVLSH